MKDNKYSEGKSTAFPALPLCFCDPDSVGHLYTQQCDGLRTLTDYWGGMREVEGEGRYRSKTSVYERRDVGRGQ